MDRNHILLAGADREVATVAVDEPRHQEIRALATSGANAGGAFQSIINRAVALSAQVGADSVYRLYSAIDASFNPIADSAMLRRAHQALSGQTFVIGDTAATTLLAAQQSTPPAGSPITIIYVNGVGNSPADAVATVGLLRSVMEQSGLIAGQRLMVKLFYNATWTERPEEVGRCLVTTAKVALNASVWNWGKFALNCTTLADFQRAAKQMADVLGYVPGAESEDAKKLAERLRAEQQAGRAVIVLGHSQGTLIAQQALTRITEGQTDGRLPPATCLGWMNLAAPVTTTSGPLVAKRDAVVVEGSISKDIILWLELNKDERIQTYLSNYYDSFRESLLNPEFTLNPIQIGADLTLSGLYPIIAAFSEYHIHMIDADYLGTVEGRSWVMGRLKQQISIVSASCQASGPALLTVVSGQGQTAPANTSLPQPIVVKLTNGHGVALSNTNVRFAVVEGGGHVSSIQALTDASGSASTTLTLGPTVGPNAVEVTVAGSGVAPVRVTATATAARSLSIVGGDGQSATPGARLPAPIAVRVSEAASPVAGVAISFQVTSGGGTLDYTSVTTGTDGIARNGWTLGAQTGDQTLSASATGVVPSSVTFHADATGPALPTRLQVSAGNDHACATTASGRAYCWGSNTGGALGNDAAGGGAPSPVPVQVSGGHVFSVISAGGDGAGSGQSELSCGIRSDRTAMCWGSADYGMLGTSVTTCGFQRQGACVPVPVSGNHEFTSIVAGSLHACAIASDGAAWCWGYGGFGQLGTGTNANSATPLVVAGGLRFTTIDANRYWTCGLTPAGAAYCWGSVGGGLGSATAASGCNGTCVPQPTAVVGGLTFKAITVGGSFSCGITTTGDAYCWGSNDWGQLGTGTTASSLVPVKVSGGLKFKAIDAGAEHTCAVTEAGAAYCWGQGLAGNLGNGTSVESHIPVAVSGGLNFSHVSGGTGFSCGATTNARIYCWGWDSSGKLGNGDAGATTVPAFVFDASVASSARRARTPR